MKKFNLFQQEAFNLSRFFIEPNNSDNVSYNSDLALDSKSIVSYILYNIGEYYQYD